MHPNNPLTPSEQPEQPPVSPAQPETAQPGYDNTPPAPQQPSVEQPMAAAPETAPSTQPAFVPPQSQQQAYQVQPAAADPGRGLGIAGFVLAFFFPIVGLPLSIVGYSRSKKAGMKNGLALAGIILNSVFIALSVLMILITVVAFQGIQERAKGSSASFAAQKVVQAAEVYNMENGEYSDTGEQLVSHYPQSFSELDFSSDAPVLATTPLTGMPAEPDVIEFYACGDRTGNKVGYWNFTERKVVYEYAGDADETSSDCTLVTQ